uniref:Ribosomal protein L5 n=1 Tax=Imasa heleensis TaxID=2772037 RepID=A0A893DDC3_9EUKA|nr:ribosomal protein L5 [Imasa heleensis]QRR29743.1 ribosomal protein L5 [Imasa heleensis]
MNSSFIEDSILRLNSKNPHKISSITKIVISLNYKFNVVKPIYILQLIFGRKPLILKSKKSIANFNLREGMYSSYKITIRGKLIDEFLNLMQSILFVRLSLHQSKHKFKINNNSATLAVPDVSIFPQIESEMDKINSRVGLQVTYVFSTNKRNEITSIISNNNIL